MRVLGTTINEELKVKDVRKLCRMKRPSSSNRAFTHITFKKKKKKEELPPP